MPWSSGSRPDSSADGLGLWAVEARAGGEFLGFAGLARAGLRGHTSPRRSRSVGGWRRPAWGNGYATEAARAALAFGFDEVGLDEVVSFAVPGRTRRSRAVMETARDGARPRRRLRASRSAHRSPLRPHVLYQAKSAAGLAGRAKRCGRRGVESGPDERRRRPRGVRPPLPAGPVSGRGAGSLGQAARAAPGGAGGEGRGVDSGAPKEAGRLWGSVSKFSWIRMDCAARGDADCRQEPGCPREAPVIAAALERGTT